MGQIFKADCANGEGMRVSVFVSGCTNRCEGCFQPETWDFSYGEPYTKEMEDAIIEELSHPYYAGLTVLGGEPFEIQNQECVSALVCRVKKELPKKTVWLYSGFSYDVDLAPGGKRYTKFTDAILDTADVLVDGKFELAKKNISLLYRGSENQRIIDLPASRKEGRVILSPLNRPARV